MKRTLLVMFAALLFVAPAFAAPHGDAMTPIRQFIDGFNNGDTKSAFAAYAAGDILVIDEFAPHRWFRPHAARDWAAAYDKHARATGVAEGSVKYGNPARVVIDEDVAYVIVPTVYLYKDHGAATAEEGQMTFVLLGEPGGWKISSWVWSGVKPHPAR
jgi:hypothetical protein